MNVAGWMGNMDAEKPELYIRHTVAEVTKNDDGEIVGRKIGGIPEYPKIAKLGKW